MVKLVKHDLDFILKQIGIAERHAAGEQLDQLVDSPLLPYGLRTVDGSYNNFLSDRENYGASGFKFKHLVEPSYTTGNGSMGPGYPSNNDYGVGGNVVDADPRLISNLIVDQTPDNPAAIMAALHHAGYSGNMLEAVNTIRGGYQQIKALTEALEGVNDTLLATLRATFETTLKGYGLELDGNTILLPNVAPDEGISASYNSVFTLFGQFFDHGLDLVAKGGNNAGTIFMPLSPDDPLYNPAKPHTNFMVLTRASTGEEARNITTPWVDQNQTYTSHPSHQVFLREYNMVDGKPVATGHLLEGANGGLATWADIKKQAAEKLGIALTDKDVTQVPNILVDPYGNFIPGENGLPQILAGFERYGADANGPWLRPIHVSGDLASPVDPSAIQLPPGTQFYNPSTDSNRTIADGETVSSARVGHAFLDDIAHNAVPVVGADGQLVRIIAGAELTKDVRGNNLDYDGDLLDAHFITGDGRGNENIGLTAIHHLFHSEHNRIIDHAKSVILESGDLDFLNEWLIGEPLTSWPADTSNLEWNGERLFQAGRFVTEMQYQHLVFEEFARKIQPDVDIFMVQPDVELDPTIFAEFAHVVYRFGHSMLNETVERVDANGNLQSMDLFDAFLNPIGFGEGFVSHDEAAGAILRGMSYQVGNEIDEFVTNTLRNQLLGIPLDLAAINIARGRDTGTPTLNEARAKFMEMAGGDTQLRPYENWSDFALNLKNPASIINFIAAYGTHASITSATTAQAKRDAAFDLVMGGANAPADRLDFLNGTGAYAGDPDRGGLQNIDLWIGGLAEKKMSFGGMLGSTFAFVFEMQMENLQDADRFYYLSRTQGLNMLTELENNSLAKIAMRNTDLGEEGFALPADIFAAPGLVLYMDLAKQLQLTGKDDPTHSDPTLGAFTKLVERAQNYLRYNGDEHVVMAGSEGNDTIIAGDGDDAIWGFGGDDRIEAGYGVDMVEGGDGDDIITNSGTDIGATDMLKGGAGNDVIHGGSGLALLFGGEGKDFLMTGPDGSEARGGTGNDFLLGGDGSDMLFGNEGDDWVEGKGRFDYIAGDNGELFFNSTIIGHDVLNGGQGDTDYDADSGDDIMVGGEGIQKFIGMWGHDWVTYKGQATGANADMNFPMFPNLPLEVLRDRFSQVEALSGWMRDDVLRGDDRVFNDTAEQETETETEEEEVEEEQDENDAVTPGFTVVEVKEEAAPDVYDPTPEGNFVHNELDQAGIDRIAGLGSIITPEMMREVQYWADNSGQMKQAFVGGNILLGGGGSDLIEGRGGDDVIDGDAWLNVRIRFEHQGVAYTTDSMDGKIYREGDYRNQNGKMAGWDPAFGGRALTALALDRTVNPGDLHIVREILYDNSGTDTAFYWDNRANYALDGTSDGRLVVEHVQPVETDAEDGNAGNPFDPITGKNRTSDGRDVLSNIEQLQFGDGTVGIMNGTSASNTLNGSGGNDIILGLDGNDTLRGNAGDDVLIGGRGSDRLEGGAGADRLIGGLGNDALDGGSGNDTYVFGLTDGSDTITENSGNGAADRIVIKTAGGALESLTAHDSNTGTNNGNLVIGYNGNQITVSNHYSGTNSQTGVDLINFEGGSIGGYQLGAEDYAISKSDSGSVRSGTTGNDFIAGENTSNQSISGGNGNDLLFGGSFTDNISGGSGNDLLVGGAGNDNLDGGDGDDTILWRVGDGSDTINGGTGEDTVHITGNGSAETYTIMTRSEAIRNGISQFQLASNVEIVITRGAISTANIIARIRNVEEIVINGMGGGDTFQAIGNFAGTSLSYSTITLEGSEDSETVDISGLLSAHRIYFRSQGGNDTILGGLRSQDVIELPKGKKAADYRLVENSDGTSSLVSGDHVITFTRGEGTPQVNDGEGAAPPVEGNAPGTTPPPVEDNGSGNTPPAGRDDDDHDDDDRADCGDRDDDKGGPDDSPAPTTPAPTPTPTPTPTPAPTTPDPVPETGARGETIFGTDGNDNLMGGSGRDMIFGGKGRDNVLGGSGNDMLFGDANNDRLIGEDGDDYLEGGYGDDSLFGGNGDDTFVASRSDGNDQYWGGDGDDTLDMSAITANITADLGSGLRGSVHSSQTGTDSIHSIENIVTGSGNDVITASSAVNVIDGGQGNDIFRFLSAADADGDTILNFSPGDRIDLSGIDANAGAAGNQSFTLVSGAFSGRGQLMVRDETRDGVDYTVIEGNTSDGTDADFKISIKGRHQLTETDFNL